jgi:hypothetical protein
MRLPALLSLLAAMVTGPIAQEAPQPMPADSAPAIEQSAPETVTDIPLPMPRPDRSTLSPATDEAVPQPQPDQPLDSAPADEAPADEVPAVAPQTPADDVAAKPAEEGVVAPADDAPKQSQKLYQVACPAVIAGRVEAKILPPLVENICGEHSPLSLTGVLVHGRMVPVTGDVVTNCQMATVLPDWAEAIDGYLQSKENTTLAGITVGTSYMCRNRNNAETGDVSEHGFADAMDVVGFKLEDGRTVNVETGWPDALSAEGRLLRYAHDAACSRFTTTLGPEANALHHDHLHIDLGCHGKTCTARMCE